MLADVFFWVFVTFIVVSWIIIFYNMWKANNEE